MELSVIIERDIPDLKEGTDDPERSTDSGVASTGMASTLGNSGNSGKDVIINKNPIIIEFKALNAKDSAPKESTFVVKTNENGNPCDISAIAGDGKDRETFNSSGKNI